MTLAELSSRVMQGIDDFIPDYCSLEDVLNAIVQVLNLRTAQTRNSSINVILSTTPPFVPTENPYQITYLIGKGIPVNVELRQSDGRFYPIRLVNISNLQEWTGNTVSSFNEYACAFFTQEGVNAGQFLQFNYLPNIECRIGYDADVVSQQLGAASLLPDTVSELIVLEAQNSLIPRIRVKIAMNLRRDENERKDAAFIISALDGVYQQNMMNIAPLEQLWKVWAFKDRQSEGHNNRPVPSGRRLYGD